ncbi:MAG: hypothetical protein WA364_17065, partial [Candidatus Nitrosopolaris sp.]
MHKNTYAILSAIAISAILLTSFTMVGMQFSQRASGQQTSSPPSANSSMAAAPSANSSMAAGAAPSANSSSASTQATAEPTSGQSFVWQGTASSEPSPLPGHEKDYVAYILQPRSDKSVYSGVLTYTVSRSEGAKGWPNVEIWHTFSPGNKTAIPSSFGVMKTATFNKKPITLTDLSSSGSAGSVPFSGNAVLLHASSPFIVAYTVNAVAQPAKIVNNIQTAMAQPTSSTSGGGPSSSGGGPSSSGGGPSSSGGGPSSSGGGPSTSGG